MFATLPVSMAGLHGRVPSGLGVEQERPMGEEEWNNEGYISLHILSRSLTSRSRN